MEKTIVNTSRAPKAIGPYSQAVKAGNMLFVSGQLPINPDTGELITTDIAKATDQVMKNMWAILNEAGMDFSDVVKCSIFVTDLHDFAIINATYEKFFDYDPPARETVQVKALPKGASIEISCIAVS